MIFAFPLPSNLKKKLIQKPIPTMMQFWMHFGPILAPSWDPQHDIQNGPKMDFQWIEKFIKFWMSFWTIFLPFWPPTWGPQGEPKVNQNFAFSALQSSWSQLGPTWANLEPTWGLFGSTSGHFGPPWAVLGPTWGALGRLGPARGQFGPKFVQNLNRFWPKPAQKLPCQST